MVRSGQGDTGAVPVVSGMLVGAGFSETAQIAETFEHPSVSGKLAILIGLALVLFMTWLRMRKEYFQERVSRPIIVYGILLFCSASVVGGLFVIFAKPEVSHLQTTFADTGPVQLKQSGQDVPGPCDGEVLGLPHLWKTYCFRARSARRR